MKAVESGVIIWFRYHVLNPDKAKMLSDQKFEPVLQCPEKDVQLVIPSLEKVGAAASGPTHHRSRKIVLDGILKQRSASET